MSLVICGNSLPVECLPSDRHVSHACTQRRAPGRHTWRSMSMARTSAWWPSSVSMGVRSSRLHTFTERSKEALLSSCVPPLKASPATMSLCPVKPCRHVTQLSQLHYRALLGNAHPLQSSWSQPPIRHTELNLQRVAQANPLGPSRGHCALCKPHGKPAHMEKRRQGDRLHLDVLVAAGIPDMHPPVSPAHGQVVAVVADRGCQ